MKTKFALTLTLFSVLCFGVQAQDCNNEFQDYRNAESELYNTHTLNLLRIKSTTDRMVELNQTLQIIFNNATTAEQVDLLRSVEEDSQRNQNNILQNNVPLTRMLDTLKRSDLNLKNCIRNLRKDHCLELVDKISSTQTKAITAIVEYNQSTSNTMSFYSSVLSNFSRDIETGRNNDPKVIQTAQELLIPIQLNFTAELAAKHQLIEIWKSSVGAAKSCLQN